MMEFKLKLKNLIEWKKLNTSFKEIMSILKIMSNITTNNSMIFMFLNVKIE